MSAPDAIDKPDPGLTIGTAAALGLMGSLANVGFSVLRSKVMALKLGPEGLGKIAEINQLVTLANVATVTMTGAVLINHLAQARAAGDDQEVRRVVSGAWTGAIVVSGLAGILAVILGRVVLPSPWGPSAWPLVTLAAIGAMFGASCNVPNQALIVFTRLDKATSLSIVATLIQTALIIGAVIRFGLYGFFVATALGALLLVPMWLRTAARYVPALKERLAWHLDRRYIRDAVRFGGATLVASVFGQFLFTLIRWLLERQGGPQLNGQYQAATTVGTQYLATVLAGLGSFAFPRYAAARTPRELEVEVEATCAFVLRLAPPIILGGIAFRDVAVHLLYSLKFANAADLLGWLMVGDLAKVVSWAIAGPLLVRGRLRAFMLCEGAGVVFHLMASFLLIPRFGLVGEGYAQMISYVVYMFLALVVVVRSCELRLSYRWVLVVLPLTGVAIVALLSTQRWPAARWVIATLAVGWGWRSGLLGDILNGIRTRFRKLQAALRRRG